MSDAGFSYVGLILDVKRVVKKDRTVVEGLYHVECQGYGPDAGDDRRLSVNSHAKAEAGGQLNPYYSVITSNQGTGVPVQFKGWVNSTDDGWGNVKEYWNVNGARLWQADGQQPQPAQQPPGSSAPAPGSPAPTAPPPAQERAPQGPTLADCVLAVTMALQLMPPEVAEADGKVRGAYARQQGRKLLVLAGLLHSGDLGQPWEQLLENKPWKDEQPQAAPAGAEEPPADQGQSEPAEPRLPETDWSQPSGTDSGW